MRRFTPLSYLVFWLALPFFLLHKKLRQGSLQRLGFYPRDWPPLAKGPQRVWVHGASAGDILALLPTVRVLKRADATLQIVATTLTDSGLSIARGHPELLDTVAFCPYDLPGATRRAFRRIAPTLLILEYTELWPQLVHAAAAAKVPLYLHNGRLSQGKLPQYRWLFAITGNLLQKFDGLLMRDSEEAARAFMLGAGEAQVRVTGNTKFDQILHGAKREIGSSDSIFFPFPSDAPVWVIGSSHEGEEKPFLKAFRELRRKHPNLRLIIAPRYVDRGEKIASQARQMSMRVQLRTGRGAPRGACDLFVLNSIGELIQAYQRATLVLVGGSFVSRGGQNILEPAMCGKAVIFGPDMRNFKESVQVLHGRGGIQVQDYQQLHKIVDSLLIDPVRCRQLGTLAQQQVSAVSGAAERNGVILIRAMRAVSL